MRDGQQAIINKMKNKIKIKKTGDTIKGKINTRLKV